MCKRIEFALSGCLCHHKAYAPYRCHYYTHRERCLCSVCVQQHIQQTYSRIIPEWRQWRHNFSHCHSLIIHYTLPLSIRPSRCLSVCRRNERHAYRNSSNNSNSSSSDIVLRATKRPSHATNRSTTTMSSSSSKKQCSQTIRALWPPPLWPHEYAAYVTPHGLKSPEVV